jgi:mono/diheme cytochrome c family protein
MSSRHVLALVLLILLAILATAQKPIVKQVPCPKTSPTSGQEMYVAYCASCHGRDGVEVRLPPR